jgi:hypothetical protein
MTSHNTALAGPASSQSRDFSLGVAPDSPEAQLRPLDAPEVANRNESAQGYSRLVAVLNGKWRIIECRDGIQWILQACDTLNAPSNAVWRGRSYCRTKQALLQVCAAHAGAIDPTAAARLAALPPLIGQSSAGNEQENFATNTRVRRNAPATSSLNQENEH